ncbi:MAG: polysaccharide biosynthesis protein [Myxococcales bacterium]|nr:polysaccharide biosynthesis protein [Myxococcales bacterium]
MASETPVFDDIAPKPGVSAGIEAGPSGPSPARTAGWVVVGRAFGAAMSIALVLLLTRILDKGDFGRLGLVLMLYETLEMFALSGIPASLLFLIPTEPRSAARSIAVTSALILSVIAAVVALIVVIFAPVMAAALDDGNPVVTEMLRWMALYVVLAFPAQVIPNYLLATSRPRGSAAFGFLIQFVRFFAVLIPATLGMHIETIMLWLALSGIVPFLIFVTTVLWLDRQYPIGLRKKWITQQFSYGGPLAVASGLGKLNAYADKYMVGVLMPMEALAVYNVASRELPFVSIVPYGATTGLIPEMSRRFFDDKEGFLTLWRVLMRKVALLMYPVFVFFFVMAPDIITILYTDAYVEGTNVFRVYLCLIPFRLCLYGGVLRAMGDTIRVLTTSGLSIATNLLLNIPLYYWLGWVGPALATIVGQLIAIVLLTHNAAHRLQKRIVHIFPWWPLAKTLLVASAASVVLWPIVIQDWPSGIKVLAGMSGYCVSYFVLGIVSGMITKSDLIFIRTFGRAFDPSGNTN